jgi:hypothetical protein
MANRLSVGEFLHPLSRATQRDLVLAVMYYLKRYNGEAAVTTADIKAAFASARHSRGKRIQYAAVLNQAVPYVESPGGEGGRLLWSLTDFGEKRVRELLDLPAAEPEVEHDVSALTKLAAKVPDEDVRDYIEEAIKCLRAGAFRASVVFLWTGAIATLRDELWKHGAAKIDAEVKKYQPKTDFKKKDDFALVKDVNLIEVAENLGRFDKGEKQMMQQALTVRNQCGHPGKYSVREKKVSAVVEDVLGIVFT